MTAIAVKWFPIENGRKKRVLSAAMEYRSSIVLQNLLFRALQFTNGFWCRDAILYDHGVRSLSGTATSFNGFLLLHLLRIELKKSNDLREKFQSTRMICG